MNSWDDPDAIDNIADWTPPEEACCDRPNWREPHLVCWYLEPTFAEKHPFLAKIFRLK
jgi:hypothetical protein